MTFETKKNDTKVSNFYNFVWKTASRNFDGTFLGWPSPFMYFRYSRNSYSVYLYTLHAYAYYTSTIF